MEQKFLNFLKFGIHIVVLNTKDIYNELPLKKMVILHLVHLIIL